MTIEYRRAVQGDIPYLCTLSYEQYKEERFDEFGHTYSSITSFAGFEKIITTKTAFIVHVALDGEEIVGYITSCIAPPPYNLTLAVACEKGWYVKPSHRGMGVGFALLDKMESYWRAFGCKHFSIGSRYGNDKLLEAYKRRGYFPSEYIFLKYEPPKSVETGETK